MFKKNGIKIKRCMSMLLVMAMVIGMLPMSVLAGGYESNHNQLNQSLSEEVTIETTLKDMTTKADKITFDLWAKNPSGEKISASDIVVTNKGKPVAINWDDLEKTSYTLNLEVGENNVKIEVNYGGQTYLQENIIHREEAEDGDVIGTFTFSLEAATVGLGYLIEPVQVDILKGENAAHALDRLIKEYGYKYEKTGTLEGSFYLATLLDGDETEIYKNEPSISQALKDKLDENYDEEDYDSEYGLGEFDFNSMSGWMYAVNNVFPNVGFADKYPQDGDVMRVQFTLAYGNDIGGADAMGGGYENNMFPKVNRDDLTKKIAEINSSGKKEEYLQIEEVKVKYNNAIEALLEIGIAQEDLDKSLSDLEKVLDNGTEEIKIASIDK